MHGRATLAGALVVVVLLAGCGASTGPGGVTATPTEDSTIAVTGSGSADGEPNRAVVEVAVVATTDSVTAARRRLAEKTSRMRAALERAGVDEDQITTQRFDIRQDREFREGRPPIVRYRGEHSFRITLNDTDRAGPVIDTAVRNGATEVEDIRFTLSTDRRRRLEGAARRSAMADARAKARQLAASANLTITGVKTIRTVEPGEPRPSREFAAAAATATPAAPTDLESGPVTVATTVQVVYTVEPAEGSDGSGESGRT